MRRSRQRGTVDYLFLLLLLAFFFLSAPANGLIPVNYQIEFVSRHNYWRGQVDPSASNMEALYWSDTLGTYAQAWSDMCTFAHSGSAYGENVFYLGGGSPLPSMDGIPTRTVDSWQSEVENYDYANASCAAGKVCGHYTQVVWATTTGVGCGMTSCSPLNNANGGQVAQYAVLVVCNYSPAGNVYDPTLGKVGRPYIAGPSPQTWATSTATSRAALTSTVSDSRTSTQSTSLAVVSTTANAAGPTVASTASTSISVTTTSYAGLTTTAMTTSTASATRSTTVGVVSTTFGASMAGGGQSGSSTSTAAATTTAAATSSRPPIAPVSIWVVRVTTARCLVLSTVLPAWASAAGLPAARLQVMSYSGCSPYRQAGAYLLQLVVLEDPIGSLAKNLQGAIASLGSTDVVSSEVQRVWLSTAAPAAPASPKNSPPSVTLVVMVVALAIAAAVILLLAAIIACLALRKPPSVIVRSEPLLPGWPHSQPMSVLSPQPRLSTNGYDLSGYGLQAQQHQQQQRASDYTRLDDDQVLAALYAAAGASNPLARQ